MRIVGGDHEVIVADMVDEDRREIFAGLAADPAVALEVGARLFFGDLGRAMRFMLPVLVHAL